MIQREAQDAGAPFHFGLLPYPEQPISITPAYGGGLAPRKEFYESYDDQDIRKRNEEFSILLNPNMVIRRQRLLWMFLIYANIGMRMPNLQERAGRIFRFTVMRTFY